MPAHPTREFGAANTLFAHRSVERGFRHSQRRKRDHSFARRRLGATVAYLVLGVYLLYWPLQEALDFDFHEVAFVPVLTAVMVERFDAGRLWPGILAAAALLLVKEDMGLLVAGFGCYLLLTRRRWTGLAFVVGGLAVAPRESVRSCGSAEIVYASAMPMRSPRTEPSQSSFAT